MLQSFEHKWWEGLLKLILKSPRKIKLQNCVTFMFSKISKRVSKISEEALGGLKKE